MKTWLITGSTGFIGRELVRALARDREHPEDRYVLLVRSLEKLSIVLEPVPVELRGRFQGVQGDLDRLDGLDPYVAQVCGVLHVAGLVDAKRPEEFDRVNLQGTISLHQRVMDRSQIKPVRWIQISSIAANGPVELTPQDRRADVDQDHPTSAYGRSKLAADQYLKKHHPEDHVVVVRPPPVFGPEDQAWLPVLKLVRKRVFPVWTGPSCPYFSFIDVATLVDVLCVLMRWTQPIHETIYPCFEQPVHWNQLLAMTRGALGLKGRWVVPIPLSGGWLKMAARLMEVMSRVPGAGRFFAYGGDKLRLVGGGSLVKDGSSQLRRLGIRVPKDMTPLWTQCIQSWATSGKI